jgi:hypothetical protein
MLLLLLGTANLTSLDTSSAKLPLGQATHLSAGLVSATFYLRPTTWLSSETSELVEITTMWSEPRTSVDGVFGQRH